MKKYILSFLALLLTSSVFSADIPVKNRVKNRPPGYCAWCCLEMLGKTHNVDKLKNISTDRDKDPDFIYGIKLPGQPLLFHTQKKNEASELSVRTKLDSLGVKYKMSLFDREHLKKAAEPGGMVFMKAGSFGPGGHAILIVGYEENKVFILDPNDTLVHEKSKEWFDKSWDGWTITLEPQDK